MGIVTEDKQLVVLEKTVPRSVLAATGRRWTYTVEEGLVWAKDVRNGKLDLYGCIKRGVEMELGINREEIAKIEFYELALEHTHLNAAVLGIMILRSRARDLVSRIEASEDFIGTNCRFVSLESAFLHFFSEENSNAGSWHPTGRMRILLGLYNLLGRDSIWKDRGIQKST